jgi:hypothetical protein
VKTQNFDMDRERVTGAMRVIMSDHANIHGGEGFNAWIRAEAVADDGFVQLEFTTPAGIYVHMKSVTAMSEGLADVTVVRSPTLTTGNTAVVSHNLRDIGTPAASAVVIKSNPTSISAGTIVRAYFIGAGKDSGGPSMLDTEIVLNPETTYLFRVQNLAGSAKALSLYLFWYEESGA